MSVLLADPGQSEIERRLERLERSQITAFTVREALRAAPLLAIAGPERIARLAQPCFRAIVTARVAALLPEARDAAVAAADAAFETASTADVAHSAIYAAARAATAAAASHAAAAAYAGYAAAYSSARAAAAPTVILDEAFHDLESLQRKCAAEHLLSEPLWPFATPPEFPRAVDRLSAVMRQGGPDAAAWADWYLSKIDGWPGISAAERAWVLTAD